MSENINVKIKMSSNNQTYEVSVAPENTILEFKQLISEKSGLKENEQNLVYKGKILADDKILKDYNIQNDHTIILVKKFVDTEKKEEKKPTTTTTTTVNQNTQNVDPFSMGGLGGMSGMGGLGGLSGMGGMDPSQLGSMLNNPMYMQMMNEMLQDPNTLNMIMNSPQLKPLLDSNPQMRQMLQNPQMMQMLMNPQNLQNAMSMMGQGGLGGLGGMGQSQGQGQGFNPFSMGGFGGSSNFIINYSWTII
jgi:ubiquilin